jgi:hypothetical protein
VRVALVKVPGITAVVVRLIVPDDVIGPPVRPAPVATEVTVPDPPPPPPPVTVMDPSVLIVMPDVEFIVAGK